VSGDNAGGHPHIQWLSDPAVLAPLALLAGIYVWRFRQARREAGGRGAGPLQAAAFAGAMFALLAALASPIEGLGEDYLFSAHMVQHVLLGDIAAAAGSHARDHAPGHPPADTHRAGPRPLR
jgi:cytochrome c oxidase assembly factor CtaG